MAVELYSFKEIEKIKRACDVVVGLKASCMALAMGCCIKPRTVEGIISKD